jgi:hypothetical protein
MFVHVTAHAVVDEVRLGVRSRRLLRKESTPSSELVLPKNWRNGAREMLFIALI